MNAHPLFLSLLTFLMSMFHHTYAQQETLLWPEGAPGALGERPEDKPSMFVYQAPAATATGAAVLVCPGGGYTHLAMDHEGHDVARWFNSMGITAFVLKYRLGTTEGKGYHHPVMLNDAQRAIRLIRSGAGDYGIDPDKIGVMGFSAGGHLASTLGTHYNSGSQQATHNLDRTNARPNFMILIYPVISLNTPYTHRGSRKALLGDTPALQLVDSLSNDTQINSMTPPTFLVHSTDDAVVPPENSIQFYLGLRRSQVPAEMHIYEYGGHGYGMAPNDPVLHSWTSHCREWLTRMKMARQE